MSNSFLNKRNKLNFIYNNELETKKNIENQVSNNKNIIYNVDINKPLFYNFKRITDLSFDWVELDNNFEGLSSEEIEYLFGFGRDKQWKNWIITWELIDIRILPFINIDVILRTGSGDTPINPEIIPILSKYFIIEETSSEYYKKVSLNVSIYLSGIEIFEIYQSKLNIILINPKKYF